MGKCTWIEEFRYSDKSKKDYFKFCDAVYIMTMKKPGQITNNQKTSIFNTHQLGCGHKTFWCLTKGIKDKDCNKMTTIPQNVTYNTQVIIKHALKNKYNNIVIFEDDVILTNNLWDNYEEKVEHINYFLKKMINKPLSLYLGYQPQYYYRYSKYLNKGRFFFTHCYLLNVMGMKRILDYKLEECGIDLMIIKDVFMHTYGIRPNNLFFQKSEINSQTGKNSIPFQPIMKRFTGRNYYNYDPKFAPYFEPFVENISTFSKILIYIILLKLLS